MFFEPKPSDIPLAVLKHGGVYKIRSRNLRIGVYNSSIKGFTGIRKKLDETYLFEEFHWDIGPPFGTANAEEFIEICPPSEVRAHWIGEQGQQYVHNESLFDYLTVIDTLISKKEQK